MKYCLDTSIIVQLFRGNPRITANINEAENAHELCITIISVYELYKGIHSASKKETHFQKLKEFLKRASILTIDENVCDKAGSLFANLRKENQVIEDADLLIAAIALNNDAVLVTANPAHFTRVKNLQVENWL